MHSKNRWRNLILIASVTAVTSLVVAGPGASALAAPIRAAAANGAVAWGDNSAGQLGNGTVTASGIPVGVGNLSGVKALAAGDRFTLALRTNGTVEAWGDNTHGQLGDGTTASADVPVPVKGLTGVTAVAAGGAHALALLSNGTVVAWGDNTFGQLGNPGTPLGPPNSDVPVPVQGLSGTVTAVSAGGQSSLALLKGGSVAAWGDNALGQLGNGSASESTTPVTVTGLTGATAISGGSDYGAALVATPGPSVTGTPESIFHIVPTPSPGVRPLQNGVVDDSLVAVSAPAASNALAVGNKMRGITKMLFGEHWNGTKWTAATIPSPAGRNPTIHSVVDLSRTDGWAVGFTTTPLNSTDRTLIEHWNGSTWSTVPSPNPIGGTAGNDELEAVDGVSPTDVWAVGQDFSSNGGGITLLFEHFNGTKWTVFPFPASTGAQFAQAITTISANDAWVVGSNALATTLAVHWNGKTWTIVPTPTPQDGPSPINNLTGVSAVSPADVYASGFEGNVNNQNFDKPYVLHWNGSAWSLVTLPNAGGEGSQLFGVTALSAGDVWAVGHTQESDGAILTLGEHFNGTAWSIAPTPDPGSWGRWWTTACSRRPAPGMGPSGRSAARKPSASAASKPSGCRPPTADAYVRAWRPAPGCHGPGD